MHVVCAIIICVFNVAIKNGISPVINDIRGAVSTTGGKECSERSGDRNDQSFEFHDLLPFLFGNFLFSGEISPVYTYSNMTP